MINKAISIIEAIKRYLKECLVDDQSLRTIEGKEFNLKQFERWHSKNYGSNLCDITDDTIDAYKHYLIEYVNPQTKKVIGKATRRNKLTAVKTFCERLFELWYFDVNPTARLRLPKRPTTVIKGILQPEEINAISSQAKLHGVRGIRDNAIVQTYFSTSIRRCELAKLKLNHLNEEAEVILIEQGKGEQDRIVPIASDTVKLIQEYLNNVRSDLQNLKSGNVLFLDDNGREFTGSQLTALIKKYKQRAGIDKPGSCNLFRHTGATTMLENDADLPTIQKILGHSDISTTQKYLHVSIHKMIAVYKKTHPSARKGQRGSPS
jgi:integrase/recombinase XerD